MSDPSEKQLAPFPLPGIISILVALLAIFAEQFAPLKSSRPAAPKEVKLLSKKLEPVDARLWQDPLAVVTDYLNTTPVERQGNHEIKELANDIVSHRPESGTQPVIVLGSNSQFKTLLK